MLSLIVDYHETNLLSQLNNMYRENISKSTDTTQELTKREDKLSLQLKNNDLLEKEQSNSNSTDLNNYGLVDFNEMKDNGKIQATENHADRTQRSSGQTLVDMNPSRLNSISLDRFTYTSNCPTKYTDPSGHCNVGKLIPGILLIVSGGVVGAIGATEIFVGIAATTALQPEGLGGVAIGAINGVIGLGIAGLGGYLI